MRDLTPQFGWWFNDSIGFRGEVISMLLRLSFYTPFDLLLLFSAAVGLVNIRTH